VTALAAAETNCNGDTNVFGWALHIVLVQIDDFPEQEAFSSSVLFGALYSVGAL